MTRCRWMGGSGGGGWRWRGSMRPRSGGAGGWGRGGARCCSGGGVGEAATLAECGVMGEGERDALIAACDELEAALGTGKAVLAGEDVHSAVEAALVERCGDPARRLHTGRSRNDQVATLMRIHVMRLCESAIEGVRELERALVSQAREAGDLACAAYTHLQPAQPVRLAHWWLAHVEALARDEERFAEA